MTNQEKIETICGIVTLSGIVLLVAYFLAYMIGQLK